jgi:hypothetical protein
MECPTILLPFIDIQQGHFWSIHFLARLCLHTAHIHPSCSILLRASISSFSRFDLRSTYNQRKITGIPMAKKIIIVSTGIRITNSDNANNTVPTPRATSQRFVRLSIDNVNSPASYLTYSDSFGFKPIDIPDYRSPL